MRSHRRGRFKAIEKPERLHSNRARRRAARSNCGPKVRYRRREDAGAAARELHGEEVGLAAYLCRECGYWHVGHAPSNVGGREPAGREV